MSLSPCHSSTTFRNCVQAPLWPLKSSSRGTTVMEPAASSRLSYPLSWRAGCVCVCACVCVWLLCGGGEWVWGCVGVCVCVCVWGEVCVCVCVCGGRSVCMCVCVW